MDYTLDIIIPKDEIETIELREQFVEWGDNIFPYEPPKYKGDSNLVFEQVEDIKYYSEILGISIENGNYMALVLKGEELLDLEFIINRQKEKVNNNTLVLFLMKLYKLREFYIILLREDEMIKEKYAVEKKEEIRNILCECLQWSKPNDILITKEF